MIRIANEFQGSGETGIGPSEVKRAGMMMINTGKWSPGSTASVVSTVLQGIVELHKIWPRKDVAGGGDGVEEDREFDLS